MAPGQSAFCDIDSDDESDAGSDYSVTQTQLAVTDGTLEGDDETNPLVSRIGGRVAWLPTASLPPANVAHCQHCSQEMELLVQIFAPLDDSPFDRIVLVWGCARAPCQKKGTGSVKAIRLLSHNARWAAKLEKKRQREEERQGKKEQLAKEQKARQEEEEKRKKVNPFSSAPGKGLNGGLGGSIFGGENAANPFGSGANANPFAPSTPQKEVAEAKEESTQNGDSNKESSETESEDEEDSEEQMAEELAIKASIESSKAVWYDQDWSQKAPAYEPAQYLTTFAEPTSSTRTEAEQKKNKAQMQKLKQDGLQDVRGWEAEKYESMMASGTDEVFERFVKRVAAHGKQIVRYEFGGVPLPFHAKGKAYEKIWPSKQAGGKTVISGQAFATTSGREYSTANIPACPKCGSNRVCEMQLMPNLVNILRPKMLKGGNDGDQKMTKEDAEAERRREIEEALGHKLPHQPDADGITRDKIEQNTTEDQNGGLTRRTGLKWNTAFVFVCEKDCHQDAKGKSSWSEELVELQYENEA